MQDQYARTEKFRSVEWQGYLRRGIEEVQLAISASQSPTGISGIPANATETELLREFRDMARGFAAALAGWVEMREVASGLATELIDSRQLLPR
jgi:hypothetical protein